MNEVKVVLGKGSTPAHGWTRHGRPVHGRTSDHLPSHNAVARFNKRVAVAITTGVGTMWCAYAFCVVALLGLPQAWQQSTAGGHFSPLPLVQWVAQTFLQLVLLSIIIVGQNVAAEASDARAAKTFEDGHWSRDALDLATPGGLREVLDTQHEMLRILTGAARTRPDDEPVVWLRADHQINAPAPPT